MRMDVFDLGAESPTEDDPTASNLTIEDDEEIDSDDAWDEEDEAKFGQYKFTNRTKQSKSANLSGDDDEDEENEEYGEYMDLSEMLGSGSATTKDVSASSDEELSSDTEDENEHDAEKLVFFGKTKRAPQIKERTEVYTESEYNLTLRDSSATGKLSLNDLYGALEDQSGLASLKKSLKAIKKTEPIASTSTSNTVGTPLAAPLAKRIQQRFDRQVAYEETTEQISQWEPAVKQNREADHVSFVDRTVSNYKPTSEAMAAQLKPTTDLEKQIHEALIKGGLRENEIKEQEELALNQLSIEEVKARRDELRVLRELMFREERKAKRVKKIKSKAYRRLRKKELERQKQNESINNPEDADELLKQAEIARARERMTLRHKNTGKWAKEMMRHGGQNAETRQAIMEQLDRHALLKQKIAGTIENSDSDVDEQYSDTDSDLSDGAVMEREKRRALDSLSKLATNDSQPDTDQVSKKGVFAMKFMQDAMKRQAEETRRLAEDARLDLERMDESDTNNDEDNNNNNLQHGKMVQGNPGRRIFDQTDQLDQETEKTEHILQQLSVNKKGTSVRLSAAVEVNTKTKSKHTSKRVTEAITNKSVTETDNPWLDSSTASKQTGKARAVITKADKASDKLKRVKQHTSTADAKSQLDANIDVDITLESTSLLVSTSKQQPIDIDKLSDESDTEIQSTVNPNALKQRELVERAFANDHVVMEEFYKEKEAEMSEEEGRTKDDTDTMPGWGQWGGSGTNTTKRKPKQPSSSSSSSSNYKKARSTIIRGVEKDKRRDAKLKEVIISEKVIKKTKKYAVDAVPFPYKDRAQYERSLQQPLGPEWNTDKVFKKTIQPRLESRNGMVIDALE
ncbi:small-subunit processome [Syncephalis fuscata]|nr:small-subunit processome [Syncephalis fuscata]